MVEKLKTATNIDMDSVSLEMKIELADQVTEASDFIKKMEPILKGIKKDIKPMLSYKTA